MALATLLCGVCAHPLCEPDQRLIESLNDGSRTLAGGRSSSDAHIAARGSQIGLAVVLLVAAGLVVRSFNPLYTLNLGFDREACSAHQGRALAISRGRSTHGWPIFCRR